MVTIAFSFVVSFIIAKVIDLTIGMRVDEDNEDPASTTDAAAEYAFGELV